MVHDEPFSKAKYLSMKKYRLGVVLFAIFAPLTAVWAVPAAASPVFFTEVDDDGCQHDDIAGIDLWSCPDGSFGSTDPDGSGNATDADGCRTEWGADEVVYFDSCAPAPTTTTTTEPPPFPFTETDSNGCEVTHNDEWNSTWVCPDGSNVLVTPWVLDPALKIMVQGVADRGTAAGSLLKIPAPLPTRKTTARTCPATMTRKDVG